MYSHDPLLLHCICVCQTRVCNVKLLFSTCLPLEMQVSLQDRALSNSIENLQGLVLGSYDTVCKVSWLCDMLTRHCHMCPVVCLLGSHNSEPHEANTVKLAPKLHLGDCMLHAKLCPRGPVCANCAHGFVDCMLLQYLPANLRKSGGCCCSQVLLLALHSCTFVLRCWHKTTGRS